MGGATFNGGTLGGGERYVQRKTGKRRLDLGGETKGMLPLAVLVVSTGLAFFLWNLSDASWPALLLAEVLAVVAGICLGWIYIGGVQLDDNSRSAFHVDTVQYAKGRPVEDDLNGQ